MKRLIYLTLFFSVMGAHVWAIPVGGYKLSIFRLLFFMIVAGVLINGYQQIRGRSVLATTQEVIRKWRRKNTFYSIAFLFFWFAYALITILWVKDYGAWFKAIYFIGLGAFSALIMTAYLTSYQDILRAFQVLAVALLVHNGIGWYEILTGNYAFIPPIMIRVYLIKGYPVSMLGNANNFALYLFISLFALYVVWVNSSSRFIRLAAPILAISNLGLMYFTQSRSSQLGLIIGLGVAALLWYIRYSPYRISLRNKNVRTALILVLVLTVLLVISQRELIVNGYQKLIEVASDQLIEEETDTKRIHLIANGFYFLRQTYGFGTGAGNIEYWMKNYQIYYTWDLVSIHNLWLEVLVGYGFIVFLGYLVYYGKLVVGNYRQYLQAKDLLPRSLAMACIAILAGFVIAAMGPSNMLIHEWYWMFWALLVAHQGISDERVAGFSRKD